MPEKALDLFEQITISPNDVIYTMVFSACAQLGDDRAMQIGKRLLDQVPNSFQNNNRILTSSIHMLMKFGDVKRAEQVFQMVKKDIVTYGAMMKGYNVNNESLKCLKQFEGMKQQDIVPNDVIFNIVIGACSRIGMFSLCQSIVDQIPLHFYEKQHINNSLIDMWVSSDCLNSLINSFSLLVFCFPKGKVGAIKKAEQIFKSINNRDTFTYSAMSEYVIFVSVFVFICISFKLVHMDAMEMVLQLLNYINKCLMI
jgi:pentatricopeptide repeat protein